jgi:uncharacterized protein YigA (DUF484 family)
MTKIKLTILSAVVVASVAAPLMIQHWSQVQLRQENKVLRQQIGQLGQLATENERLSNLVAQGNISQVLPKNDQADLLRLRGEVTRLRSAAPKQGIEGHRVDGIETNC